MQNLVQNQHGTYTFRRLFGSCSLRVSLKTKDKTEAQRIYYKLQELLLAHPYLSLEEAKQLCLTSIAKNKTKAAQASRHKLLSLLNEQLNPLQSTPLSELFDKYQKEKLRSKSWTIKTSAQANDNFKMLIDLLGDLSVSQIDKQLALGTKETLQKLPSNAKKKRQYRDKSIQELARLSIPSCDLMSVKTINIKLSTYAEVFNWAVTHGLADTNPFKGVQIKDKRNVQGLRLPFSVADLNKLFSADPIAKAKKPHHYWLPVMGLYTGARINELCQIYLDDIKQIDGIWCLQVTDSRPDQSLKTNSSKRLIPLHQDLIELGILDFTQRQRQLGQTRLFSELAFNGQKYSHEASKWFGRIKSKVLTEDESKKTFHSFRHSFTDNLVNTNNWGADPAIKTLLGHRNSDITTGLYGTGSTIGKLKNVIDSLGWEGMLEIAPPFYEG